MAFHSVEQFLMVFMKKCLALYLEKHAKYLKEIVYLLKPEKIIELLSEC
jgi:hypothetical protein